MEMNENAFSLFSETMSDKLSSFRRVLKSQGASFDKRLKKYVKDSVHTKGKSIRPMLVFAAAWGLEASSKKMYDRACAVELIHLASLIHDDIIDNADTRRSEPTIFKKYGLKVSILIGDAIFAHALSMMIDDSEDVNKRAVNSVKKLCEGEITQSILNSDKKVQLKDYFEIIENKTAVLFSLASYYGGELSGDKKWANAAEYAGMEMGLAYQIYDDICDWTKNAAESGKTAGTDLLSGKRTLPILKLEKAVGKKEATLLSKMVEEKDSNGIYDLMLKYSIFESCKEELAKHISKAKKILSKFDTQSSRKMSEFCDVLCAMI